MEEEIEKELPQQVKDQFTARKAELNTIRKDRKKNKGYTDSFASPLVIKLLEFFKNIFQDIHNFKMTTSVALHSTTKPGITALDIHPDLDDLLVTGGNDGGIAFFNKAQNKVLNIYIFFLMICRSLTRLKKIQEKLLMLNSYQVTKMARTMLFALPVAKMELVIYFLLMLKLEKLLLNIELIVIEMLLLHVLSIPSVLTDYLVLEMDHSVIMTYLK